MSADSQVAREQGENQGDGDNSAPALHPGAIVGMLATALAAGLGIGALA